MKALIKSLLPEVAHRIIRRLREIVRPRPNSTYGRERAQLLSKLSADPLNPGLHLQAAVAASGAGFPFLAYAELKTAESLGEDQATIEKYAPAFRDALPELVTMNHNGYFRLKTLADDLIERAQSERITVLDVGGGGGELAAFLPDGFRYCLVEPTVNGISGIDLPFQDQSFDFVVSCHVLEHIPIADRDAFLDQLFSKSRRGLILLNPFHIEGAHTEDRLKLVIDITNAQWAKEHLECTHPHLDEVRRYADSRGLQFYAKPNGTMTTTSAFVFVDHFARKSGSIEDLKKIHVHFNSMYMNILDSPEYPTAYLVNLARQSPEAP